MSKRKTSRKKRVLEAMRYIPSIRGACNYVGLSRSLFDRWYERDEKFRQQVDDIKEDLKDYMEKRIHLDIYDEESKTSLQTIKWMLPKVYPEKYGNQVKVVEVETEVETVENNWLITYD